VAIVNLLTAGVLAGATAGAGVLLLVRELWPARPDLATALARLDTPPRPPTTAPLTSKLATADSGAGVARIGRWLAAHATRLPIPAQDLRMLDRSTEAFLTAKAGLAVLGLALPTAVLALLWLLGLTPPPIVPVILPLGAAVVLFFAPDLRVRSEAAQARTDFRQAVAAYLELVALERAADGGPADSLERAAAVGHGRDFTRIANALHRARLVGVPPWTALAQLSETTGAEDLRDLAAIIALAGDDGAAIYTTLAAKAAALRTRTLAEAQAEANAASERLTLPAVALGLGFVLLVAYPALARVLV
jgi:Flp pilus assembly protein TadB